MLPTIEERGLCRCTLQAGKNFFPIITPSYIGDLVGTGGRERSLAQELGRRRSCKRMCRNELGDTATHHIPGSLYEGWSPLRILIATMPPWPGPQEADKAPGPWLPTVTPDAEKMDEGKGRVEP